MVHPGAIRTGRLDLQTKPSEKHRWWECVDPTYPVHVALDKDTKLGADAKGNVNLVGPPPQKEWSGSFREFMAEEARPKPNTMSSLHYTMHQTADAYVYSIMASWKKLSDTRFDFDEVTIGGYRTCAYCYITGPPPKQRQDKKPNGDPNWKTDFFHDGPRGEKDLHRGRITLPRGADIAALRAAGNLKQYVDTSDDTLILTIPKAPASGAPTGEYIALEDCGLQQQQRKAAEVEKAAAQARAR